MFKPARMTRVLIGGHKGRMEDVIRVLHKEKAVHLEDFSDPTGTTKLGSPLDSGDAASDLLLRCRGLLKALDAEQVPAREMASSDPAALVADAEAELGPVIREAAELRTLLGNMHSEVAPLQPFSSIDAELGALHGLQSIVGYIGHVRESPAQRFAAAGIAHEIGHDGSAIVVAVAAKDAAAADAILAESGFAAITIPDDVEGTPRQRLASLNARIDRNQERLDRAQQRIAGHREQWAPRLAALERHLAATVSQTQAPLSFGVTETTFHIEGWIPVKRANRVQNALTAQIGDSVYFEALGDEPVGHGDHGHSSAADEAPIKLENKGMAKPYEFMLGLLGRPRYNEIDPTKLMLIFFPLFFGLMVGDLLVGLAIMGFGLYLKKNHIFGIGGPSVGRALFMGGFIAVIAGVFVFGEALGIHFVVSDGALEEGEMSWEAVIYGTEAVLHGEAGFPNDPHGIWYKEVADHGTPHGTTDAAMEHAEVCDGGSHVMPDGIVMCADGTIPSTHDDPDAHHAMAPMAENTEEVGGIGSILTPHGTTHLKAAGMQLGFYSKIHDIQALLAWSILIAFVHLNLGFLLGIRNVAVGHGVKLAIQEKLSYILLQVGAGVAIWGAAFHGASWAVPAGVGIVVLSVGLLWFGVQKALGAPGFVAILEMLGFAGNILSYTRLAAIGASKAGMALAFAAIGFDVLGGGNFQSPIGWIFYLIGMVVITLLAMLSGGLQSLRLQFVEFFSKFYEGGGRAYAPFGRSR
jgi:V/A-type H+-transporting ATPase subunit I